MTIFKKTRELEIKSKLLDFISDLKACTDRKTKCKVLYVALTSLFIAIRFILKESRDYYG